MLSRTSVKALSLSTSLGSHTQRFWNTLQHSKTWCSEWVCDGSELREGWGGRGGEGRGVSGVGRGKGREEEGRRYT